MAKHKIGADGMTDQQALIHGAMKMGFRVSPQAIQRADDNALAAALQESWASHRLQRVTISTLYRHCRRDASPRQRQQRRPHLSGRLHSRNLRHHPGLA